MSEREELAKYVDQAAKEAGDVGALITQTKLEMAAALLRQPPAPVQVTEEMVEAALDEAGSQWGMHNTPENKRKLMRAALEAALQAGVPEEWRTCLEQARLRMLDVEAFKAGRTNILPACEAAIEHANKLLAAAPAPGEGR